MGFLIPSRQRMHLFSGRGGFLGLGMIAAEAYRLEMAAPNLWRCSIRVLGYGGLAWAMCLHGQCQTTENPLILAPPNTTVPAITNEQTLTDLELVPPALGEMSPVAVTSGISTPSGISAPILGTHVLISRTVTFNPFQPPDLITNSDPTELEPLHPGDPWNLSASADASLNYDSNVTRDSGAHLSDGYLHAGGGFDFRLGTRSEPFALELSYDYTADLFENNHQFNTYTHNFVFSSRIGRSAFVLTPFVLGRFRSVESQAALNSGRQSYNFLMAGFHGENTYLSNLVHVIDFSHMSVGYPAETGSNFEVWDLDQQLNFTIQSESAPHVVQNMQLFPWIQLRDTVPSRGDSVQELNGGVGGSVVLARNLTLRATGGWGDVTSSDHKVDYHSYSGFRYDVSLAYQPVSYLVFSVEGQRVLSFNPMVTSRDTDELDAAVASPILLLPNLTITPAIGFFAAKSDDYTSGQNSLYLQPTLTLNYRFDSHASAFGKLAYSTDIDHALGNTSYTTDLQASVGFNVLY